MSGEELTAKERMKRVFLRQDPDRIPAYPSVGAGNARLAGMSIKQFITDPESMASAILKAYKLYTPDVMLILGDTLVEAEAFGVKLKYYEDRLPEAVDFPVKDLKKDVKNIKMPDPRKDGRLPNILKAGELVLEELRKTTAVGGLVAGPFSLLMALRGPEQIYYDMVENPDYVHEMLDITTAFSIEEGRAQAEVRLGLNLGDPIAGTLSPKQFDEFAGPALKKVIKTWASEGKFCALHICGDVNHLIDKLVELGPGMLSVDAPVNLAEAKRKIAGRVVLVGNVDPVKVMLEGTPEDVKKAVKECIRQAAPGGMYMLATGCEVPPETPLANLRAFMDAAREYGKYPLELA
ncbi:MAG: uroporphyrinogen decarboxylase family protein [Candidatus Jordarchaeum sp.]|uniref:uroporphyrinogen decarboxylase family protein n=1 Tax=Candidatus Jordarchaeum sp. TaxID=2823881 RepID=UPI0040496F2E